MSGSHTTATPEKTNATSTDHPPVRENQREMLQGRGFANEAEVEQGAMIGQRVMRAIGGGSPAAPPEQFAEALGGVQGRSQAGLWRQMQRGYGNSYVGRVIQAKLTVNQPGDSYEQEADRMAAQVMAMPQRDRSIQREMNPKKEKEKIQMKPSLQLAPDGNREAGGNLEDRLNNSKGGGSPLPDDVRSFMEPRFGADFSQVRVHTGSESVQMNQDLDAQAFTHRQDVYFGAGKAPGKDALTAHELTHVVQQTGSTSAKSNNESSTSNASHIPIQRQVPPAVPIAGLVLSAATFGVNSRDAGTDAFGNTNVQFRYSRKEAGPNPPSEKTQTIFEMNSDKSFGSSYAFLYLTLKFDGQNIISAYTQAGYVRGYDGGIFGSEAAVNFSAVQLSGEAEPVTQASLLFQGFNNPSGPGFQRFAGRIIVTGDGKIEPEYCKKVGGDGITRTFPWCFSGFE